MTQLFGQVFPQGNFGIVAPGYVVRPVKLTVRHHGCMYSMLVQAAGHTFTDLSGANNQHPPRVEHRAEYLFCEHNSRIAHRGWPPADGSFIMHALA
jgi:hypothetical protein